MQRGRCPEGKVFNPRTGRCVLVDGPVGQEIVRLQRLVEQNVAQNAAAARCPAGKILNPATGRCVSIYAPIGRRLMQQAMNRVARTGAAANTRVSPRANTRVSPRANTRVSPRREVPRKMANGRCPPGTILNPRSGRCVNEDGEVGRRIRAGLTPRRPRGGAKSPPRVSPGTLLRQLQQLCYNDSDPVSLDDFKDLTPAQLREVVAVGSGAKKNCYTLDTIYEVYKTAVMRSFVPKDPLNPAHALSASEIAEINRLMKRRNPRYKSPTSQKPPYPPQMRLEFSREGNVWRVDITWNGLLLYQVGTVPADITVAQTGSSDTTTETALVAIRQLYDAKRLLTSWRPNPMRCCTVHMKFAQYWQVEPAEKIRRFRRMMDDLRSLL